LLTTIGRKSSLTPFHSEGVDGNGYFVRTNVFPDTETRIESYFKDGSLARLTGTAVHPSRYTNSVEL
jgi:hypothetical protein